MVSFKNLALLASASQMALAIQRFNITALTLQEGGGLDERDPHMDLAIQYSTNTFAVCDSTYKSDALPTGSTWLSCITPGFSWQYNSYQTFSNFSLSVRYQPVGGDVILSGTTVPLVSDDDDDVFFDCLDQGVCVVANKRSIAVSDDI